MSTCSSFSFWEPKVFKASQSSLNYFLLLVSKSCFSVKTEDNDLADFLLLSLHFSNLGFSTDESTSLAIFD